MGGKGVVENARSRRKCREWWVLALGKETSKLLCLLTRQRRKLGPFPGTQVALGK